MGLPLLLPLLLLQPAPLQAGSSAGSNTMPRVWVQQPKHLTAPKDGSIHIPFSFYHPWELAESPRVTIFWRWKEFHGAFIYNTTPLFIHEDFKNRLLLHWAEGCSNGSLQILNLWREDESMYFCSVQLNTQNHGKQRWQSIHGTRLSITLANNTTTTVDLSTSGSLCPEAVFKVALVGSVLKIAILGLIVYLWWKKSKGLHAGVRTPARGSFQNSEEKYKNIGPKGQRTDPKLDAKMMESSMPLLPSPVQPYQQPPNRSPQEVALHSTLQA